MTSEPKERHIDQDYQEIRQELIRMGLEVEEMVAQAMRALTERSIEDCLAIPERDRLVDSLEKKIDEQCMTILLRQQPAAADFRFLMAVMRIIGELERIGDSAKNMAASVEALNQEPPLKPYVDLHNMARIATEMVHTSLDSFLQRDGDAAHQVLQRDNEMDALYQQVFDDLVELMTADHAAVTRALHLLLMARNLERIADHATNVAEDVIYYLEARDIRHTPEATGDSPTVVPG